MRSNYRIDPYIGFDRSLNNLFATLVGTDKEFDRYKSQDNFPPYNIVKVSEHNIVVEVAVAGFTESEIEVSLEKNVLKIKGVKEENSSGREYLHQGIADRAFSRVMNISDRVEVSTVKLVNGMLHVHLIEHVPEVEKKQTFKIDNN